MGTPALRIALFSGNYNYVRDGANKALNRLVRSLLNLGHHVRIYSPTTNTPAFEPVGDLVSAPSFAMPFGRSEYRMAWPLSRKLKQDLKVFAPNMVHVSSPDFLGHSAIKWARKAGIPVVASMHTRFDTYLRFYGYGALEPAMLAIMRKLFNGADICLAPNLSTKKDMETLRMGKDIRIWARGIETEIFSPTKRDPAWRASLGIGANDVVVGFLGRLVMEKGLSTVAGTLVRLNNLKVPHKVLIVGDGPARQWLHDRLPDAIYAGFLGGDELGRAVASMDIFFNPSVSEAFGNVMLEAMAAGLPVVAATAPGAIDLVSDGITGQLLSPTDIEGFASALKRYCQDTALRKGHGLAGLEASKAYEWESVNHKVVDVYQELVSANEGA